MKIPKTGIETSWIWFENIVIVIIFCNMYIYGGQIQGHKTQLNIFYFYLDTSTVHFSQAQRAPWRWRINVETCSSKSYVIIYNKSINIV